MRITDTSDLWWKSAVVYCLDIKYFLDSDGDGRGDLQGLAHRIDYLAELGITCLWLMPLYPSPQRDDGYDITDFYGLDPRLGSFGDLVEVLRTARDRGMRVILDLVVNHTSDQHPWFLDARSSRESAYRDYYVWRDDPPGQDIPSVFPDEESGIWEWDKKTKQYYLHHFYRHQPDLNLGNPEVRDEIAKVIGFWMELGVSGFRVDAVPFLISPDLREGDGVPLPDPHDYLADIASFLSRRSPAAMMLGEVNLPYEQQLEFFGGEGERELSMQFDFILNQQMYLSFVREDAGPLTAALEARPEIDEECAWATFVRNHDELTLDKLSEEERQEVFEVFAPDEDQRVFDRGIRRRLPPMVGNDPRRLRLAYSLAFSLPGSSVIFYGEEIGMGDNPERPKRLAVRTPMQWTPGRNGGFSSAEPDDLVAPVVEDGFAPEHVNVLHQRREEDSLWAFFRRLIQAYRDSPEIGWGTMTILDHDRPPVLAHLMSTPIGALLAVHNLASESTVVDLVLPEEERCRQLNDLLGDNEVEPDEEGRMRLALDGYGYRWLRLVREGDTRLG